MNYPPPGPGYGPPPGYGAPQGYGPPQGYAPPPGMPPRMAAPPPIDLYEIAKGHAWGKLWTSIALTIGGLVVGALALAVGFIVFVAIIMLIAGVVMFFQALAALTDPTRALVNLGPTEVQRRQVMRVAEAEVSNPATTSTLHCGPGTALMGPTWLVYYDKDALLVTPKQDVVSIFVVQKKNSRALKVIMRAGNAVEIDIGDMRSQLVDAFSYALPHAVGGGYGAPGGYYGR